MSALGRALIGCLSWYFRLRRYLVNPSLIEVPFTSMLTAGRSELESVQNEAVPEVKPSGAYMGSLQSGHCVKPQPVKLTLPPKAYA